MSEQAQWKPVAGNSGYPFFKFDTIGKEIAGKVIAKRQAPGLEGKVQDVVDIMTAKEGGFTIALTADLKKKFEQIPVDNLVKVKFTSTMKINGKPSPMKVFDVQTAVAS